MTETKDKSSPNSFSGCVLSDKDILRELDSTVIIKPFNRHQLQPNSYDTVLGEFYYERDGANLPAYFNPLNGKHVCQFWGVKPTPDSDYGAKRAKIVLSSEEAELYGLEIGDKHIIIPAGHMILAHTNEFIGGKINVTTKMSARSTIGRGGLTVCACAGSGDVSYFNRYTYEIHNRNPVPVVLKVGARIAQITFMRTGEVETSYEKRGQYQQSSNLDDLIQTWTPLAMIPKFAIEYLKTLRTYRPIVLEDGTRSCIDVNTLWSGEYTGVNKYTIDFDK